MVKEFKTDLVFFGQNFFNRIDSRMWKNQMHFDCGFVAFTNITFVDSLFFSLSQCFSTGVPDTLGCRELYLAMPRNLKMS